MEHRTDISFASGVDAPEDDDESLTQLREDFRKVVAEQMLKNLHEEAAVEEHSKLADGDSRAHGPLPPQ